MGCRSSALTQQYEPTEALKTEPTHLTERPSSEDANSPTRQVEPDAESPVSFREEDADEFCPEPPNSNTSLVFVRPAIISQLSDTVDLCEAMKEGELRDKSEEVLERIVRAQYQVDQQGDAVPKKLAAAVQDIDVRFKDFLQQFANKDDLASVAAAQGFLDKFDRELDTVQKQFAP